MRRLPFFAAIVATSLAVLPVLAQQPPKLEPLPEPPAPPPGLLESPMEPQVTITTRGADKVEEYRMNGKLYMMKVTPPGGTPYYLVDNQGNGAWMRQDGPDGANLRVPQWVIGTF